MYVQGQEDRQLGWLESGGCHTIAALSSSEAILTTEPPADIAARLVKLDDNERVLMELPKKTGGQQ